MNNNELTFIDYDSFVKKFTELKKSIYKRLVDKETLANKTINSARSNITKQLKAFIEERSEEEAIRRVITETIAFNLKDVDPSCRIKMQALIEADVYKEIMDHLNKLEKSLNTTLSSAKESLIDKYMTSSVISTIVSRNFKNDFTEKCVRIGTDIYNQNKSNGRSGVFISGIGMAFTSNLPYEMPQNVRPENGFYFYIKDAIAYTELLIKKQEKHLRRIVGETNLPAIISKSKHRQNNFRYHSGSDIRSYLAMGDSLSMCKYANFTEFFSTVCAAPATCHILSTIEKENGEKV